MVQKQCIIYFHRNGTVSFEFPAGNTFILLNNVQCTGKERNFFNCRHSIGNHNCDWRRRSRLLWLVTSNVNTRTHYIRQGKT